MRFWRVIRKRMQSCFSALGWKRNSMVSWLFTTSNSYRRTSQPGWTSGKHNMPQAGRLGILQCWPSSAGTSDASTGLMTY